jgi:hypothetical protein
LLKRINGHQLATTSVLTAQEAVATPKVALAIQTEDKAGRVLAVSIGCRNEYFLHLFHPFCAIGTAFQVLKSGATERDVIAPLDAHIIYYATAFRSV